MRDCLLIPRSSLKNWNPAYKKSRVLSVDKIRDSSIIKIIEQLTFETVGFLQLNKIEKKPSSRCVGGFFRTIVYLRNDRIATMSMPNVSMSINDS